MKTHARPASPARGCAGFTLAELLLASVLGAMLLSALAVSTFGFTANLGHLEAKADVGQRLDTALRRLARDVREAWWADVVDAQHLRITDPDGQTSEYAYANGTLSLTRPNGDTGPVLAGLASLSFEAALAERKREGEATDHDGTWYQQPDTASAVTWEVPADGRIALGFVAPTVPGDIPGLDPDEEQVLSVQSSIVEVPVAWVNGTAQHQFEIALYEGWSPGAARPYGSALAMLSVPGNSLPLATGPAGSWPAPTTMVPFSLSVPLTPGEGYTLTLRAMGNSQIVLRGESGLPGAGADEVGMQATVGGTWVTQPVRVPLRISGPSQLTTTQTQDVVSMVTINVTDGDGQPMQRSASLLSQITDDPWLGVVPGEAAP